MMPNPVKNEKGLTIFELLITISIGGIVITLLLSILSTTLFTRNQIDYMNRLDEEVYYMNNRLERVIRDMNYRSILQLDVDDELKKEIFILTSEYDVVDNENDFSDLKQYILLVDYNKNDLFLIPVPREGYTQPNPNDMSYDAYKPLVEFPPEQYRLNSSRLLIHEPEDAQTVSFRCINTDASLIFSSCSSAFISFNLVISYELTSGESLGQREYSFSLVY